ncbi:hypothetical protein BC830DRAFT_1164737 [Chytriomyces sp. MP71]|nr:hypothetical protein BC830DRAFT_1164737 [Chytriomyces sp. MP71]
MQLALFILIVAASNALSAPTLIAPRNKSQHPKYSIYLIRHGEKPDDDSAGLTLAGEARAQCIARKYSQTGFTSLFCMDYDADTGAHARACETLQPLADATGLPLNHKYQEQDDEGVSGALLKAAQSGPVMVAWEHKVLGQIAGDLTGQKWKYPGSEFDLVWIFDPSTGQITESSEGCNA